MNIITPFLFSVPHQCCQIAAVFGCCCDGGGCDVASLVVAGEVVAGGAVEGHVAAACGLSSLLAAGRLWMMEILNLGILANIKQGNEFMILP